MAVRQVNILYGKEFENQGQATSYAISQSGQLSGIFYVVEQQENFYVDKNPELGQYDTPMWAKPLPHIVDNSLISFGATLNKMM